MTGTAFILVFVLVGSNAAGSIDSYHTLAECERALAIVKPISIVAACIPAPER